MRRSNLSVVYLVAVTLGVGCLWVCGCPVARAQSTTYGVYSAVTSLILDKNALDSMGFIISGTHDGVNPSPGYDVAFASDPVRSDFSIDSVLSATNGALVHPGTIELNGSIELGNFVFGYDPLREWGVNTGFLIGDNADIGGVLFEVGFPVDNFLDGNVWRYEDADLFVAFEFATFLNNPQLTGLDVGDIRIDALLSAKDAIPEPQTTVLVLGGGLLLLLRRRRQMR